ncbi:MAG: zinc-binding dehydrogenase [Chloroflexota bacterium]|nr:zinc-binding dehydrogenase [Chloroflexota bacterium]
MSGTMQGIFFLGAKQLELREVAIPEPAPGEVIVKVEAATTDGTDLKGYLRGHRLFKPPMPFGHEYSGIISAIGAGVTRWHEGDAVVAANSYPCNLCFYCRRGKPQLCEHLDEHWNFGAYAEYIRVPAPLAAQNMHIKPDNLSFREASVCEPLACAILCIEYADIQLGDTVAIIGAGSQSMMQVQLAKSLGAGRVIVFGRSKGRLETALQIGADEVYSTLDVNAVETIKEITNGYGADVVIEAAGNPDTWQIAPLMARKGGTVVQFSGLPGGTQISFDATHLHYGEITMKGVFHLTPRTFEQAVMALANGVVNAKVMIDGDIPLSQVEAGLLRMQRSEAVKLAVIPSLS